MRLGTRCLAGLAVTAGSAFADGLAVVNLTGVQLRNASPQSRSSNPDSIDTACSYNYVIDGMVRGRGTFSLLSILFPNPTPLAQVLETLSPGSSSTLTGSVQSQNSGQHPEVLLSQLLSGQQVILGTTVTFSAQLTVGIDAAHFAYFTLTNVVVTPAATVGYLEFTSGSATVTTGPRCPSDFNGDCFVDGFDYDDFVSCFEGDPCPPGRTADFNGDGFPDAFDYDEFVAAFERGC